MSDAYMHAFLGRTCAQHFYNTAYLIPMYARNDVGDEKHFGYLNYQTAAIIRGITRNESNHV